MDLLMNEVRSLQLKIDGMTKKLDSLDTKINEITESQQIGGGTVRKSDNFNNIIIRFFTGLRKLTPEELKKTLDEANAILSTVDPILTDQNLEQTLEQTVSKDRLKIMLKEVFDLLNSLHHSATVDASTSIESRNDYNEDKEKEEEKKRREEREKKEKEREDKEKKEREDIENKIREDIENKIREEREDREKKLREEREDEKKIQFWRKYKNKYNYIEKLKLKLPPLDNSVKETESLQSDVNANVQNDLNDNTQNDVNDTVQNDVNGTAQNDVNDTAQNDLNDKTYTLDDIIQKFDVYEMFKRKLKNSPYEDPYFKNNVKNSNLRLTLQSGETIVKPVSHVAPLIVLKKCDDLCPIPLQNKKTTGKQFPSTSKQVSNTKNTTTNVTKRETRANKTMKLTNSFNTNVKANQTKKRSLTIKNSKYEPSKKKRN
ncbi:myb-like protein X [Myzus persicae]|uniref:myb-like protein X n=1 Tax=Myzus persicae TaxID=13164 RepID=UPI000B9382EC|nr:myb-like protein X [Myzus persicae]